MRRVKTVHRTLCGLAVLIVLPVALSACESWNRYGKPAAAEPATARYPVDPDIAKITKHPYRTLKDDRGAVLGDLKAGFGLPAVFGEDKVLEGAERRTGAAVNTFLWRAALDTVGFMPVEVADVQGGVIQTGWYEDQERPNERFKVNVFIISDDLKADGVRVGVMREGRENDEAAWHQAGSSTDAAEGLRSIIVDRAKELANAS